MDSGLIGGIVGTIAGLAGAIFGMWYEARNEAKRPDRKHLTFWPSPVNLWDWRDWIYVIAEWLGVICWGILVWSRFLRIDDSIQSFLLLLFFPLLIFGHERQVRRIVDKANARFTGKIGSG